MSDERDDDLTASELASLGGDARARKLSKEERSSIAQKAAIARWAMGKGDVPQATHEGPLRIGAIEIPCAVLADKANTRVLSRIGLLRAIGRKGKAKGGRKYDQESKIPVFLTAENLKPFVPSGLIEDSAPIYFRPLAGGLSQIGYRADILPRVCNVFLDARDAGVLQPNQLHIAERCKILSRGFAVVGITALIDEATGYQEVRDRQALQAILEKFLRKELAAWARTFPDEFYKQIFRLRGWEWKGMSINRPQVVASYTKDIVYERIAKGLLARLEEKNPMNNRGYRPAKHHQWLTEDVGSPALAQHLHAVIAFMRASSTWGEFKLILDKAFPKKNTSLRLDFD